MDNLDRREFFRISAVAILSSGAIRVQGETSDPQMAGKNEAVENMTPGPTPAIALNHLGFLPESSKTLIVRSNGESSPAQFSMYEVGSVLEPFRISKPMARISASEEL